jgi:hypothetical protein
MSFDNPTQVRLGTTGEFSGTKYQVVGRAVLGETERGQVYYWNEFNLETETGAAATLVYERTERGGEWRFFAMFEPQFPITAEDAASKRVGDPLNLDGKDVRVTLLGQSRVYFIEGKPPEGVKVGDVANYFNAEGGDKMDVVSWTGAEVECYHGVNLSWADVATAFNIRLPEFSSALESANAEEGSSGSTSKILLVLLAGIIAFVAFYSFSFPSRRPPAVIRTSAPPSPLTPGSAGRLNGIAYHVQSYALVEIASVGRRFERHEYHLADEAGGEALLVCGTKPGAKDWVLFTRLQPAVPVRPQQGGAVQLGQTVNVEGAVAKVSDLFQTTVRRTEGPEADALKPGDMLFCFSGASDGTRVLARWDASRIEFFKGEALPEKAVTAAFKPPPR